MRRIEFSAGRTLAGLGALLAGWLEGALVLGYFYDGLGRMTTAGIVILLLLAAFTVLLLCGGVHLLRSGLLGTGGASSAEISPRASARHGALTRLSVVCLVASPFILVFSVPTMCGCWGTDTRERARVITMKSDLRNLQVVEERYYGDVYSYTDDGARLDVWSPSEDVTIEIAVSETGDGWSAVASHADTEVTCAVFQGDAPPEPPAVYPGEVTCTD